MSEEILTAPHFIDPKIDFAFKKVFGDTEHPFSLLSFLNAVFEATDEPLIEEVTVLNPGFLPESSDGKFCVVDIRAKHSDGCYSVIEMQILPQNLWSNRVLYYWSRQFLSQLKAGESYIELKKTFSISVLDFCLDNEPDILSTEALLEQRTLKQRNFLLRMIYIELPKLGLGNHPRAFTEWAHFFKEKDPEKRKQLSEANMGIREANQTLEVIYASPEQRERYEARKKAVLDYESGMKDARVTAKAEGRAEGIEIGEKRGIEIGKAEGLELGKKNIAMLMLKSGEPIEKIALFTGLSLQEVEQLQKE